MTKPDLHREARVTPIAEPPKSTLRLFQDVSPEVVGDVTCQDFWIGRLLEEGEEADLRWLVAKVGEDALRGWVGARGGRQLSRRSRAFWRVVLEAEPSAQSILAEALWPL